MVLDRAFGIRKHNQIFEKRRNALGTKTDTIQGVKFVVADEKNQEPPFRYLVGKDYTDLCPKCQAAIDRAAGLFAEKELSEHLASRWSVEDDPERPIMWVGDHAGFCGGRVCLVRERNEKIENQEPIYFTLTEPGVYGNRNVLTATMGDDWLALLKAKATELWGNAWEIRTDRHYLFPHYAVQILPNGDAGADLMVS
jgi:hypothetical protein